MNFCQFDVLRTQPEAILQRKTLKIVNNQRIISIGFDPMAAIVNDIRTIDGYHNIYPLAYKIKFYEIIKDELENNKYWKNYYKVLEIPSLCCRTDGKFGNMSQETKNKISEGLLKANIKRSKKTKNNISKNKKRKIYQYDLNGNFIKVWDSLIDAEKNHKGNINRNLMGLTKHAGGYIWLKEKELDKLEDKLIQIQNYIDPKIGLKRTEESRKLISQNIKGKKTKCKTDVLNLELIKEQYKILSTNQLAKIYNLSIPTMLGYLKDNKIYQFRNNYMK